VAGRRLRRAGQPAAPRRRFATAASRAIEKAADRNKGHETMVETRIEAARQPQDPDKETDGKAAAEVKLRAQGKGGQAEGMWQHAVGSLSDTHRKACAG
jgi:hypothetical protein